ncbi:hypothetical protein PMAYCL1PPCAC_05291 [Pristionchus mayeri]|uniref:Uncharacterized protein n=1 Tax=Pristionchus mayeri TaxID=1317129 RepID=A0AAN4Z9U7_9BILA|nr:hypothetical protein PMAYCL1PPCAC_05291 [Pristionchus mayeri]
MSRQLASSFLLALVMCAAVVSAVPGSSALADPDFAQFGNTLPLRAMRSSFGGMAPMVGRHAGVNFYVIDGRPYRMTQ